MRKPHRLLGIPGGESLLFSILFVAGSVSCGDAPVKSTVQSYWNPMESGTTENLRSVFGFSTGDLYAVGDNGTIVHYDGGEWTTVPSGTTADLTDVWGSSPQSVYVVGDGGTVLRGAGSFWIALDPGTTERLGAISGQGHDLCVLPDNPPGVVLLRAEFPMDEWRTIDSGAGVRFYDIQAFDLPEADFTNFVTVGEAGVAYLGRIYRYGYNVEWYETSTGTSEDLVGVYGEWPNNIIAVGADGSVIQYTGEVDDSKGVWRKLIAPGGIAFAAIGARSYNDVFMVGSAGRILNYDRLQFIDTSYQQPTNLHGVWGGKSFAFAVGDGGTILRTTEPPSFSECPDNVTVTVGEGSFPVISWSPPCAATKIAVESEDRISPGWFVAADGNLITPGVTVGTTPDHAVTLMPASDGLADGVLYRITIMRRDKDGELVIGHYNHVPGNPQATLAANVDASPSTRLRGWHYARVRFIIDGDPPIFEFYGTALDDGERTHWNANPVDRLQQLDVRPVIMVEPVRNPDTGAIDEIWYYDVLIADLDSETSVVWEGLEQ